MLRIVRRHQKSCPLTSEADPNCPSKVKCPIHVKGIGPDGKMVRESLGTRNWALAAQELLRREAGEKKEDPPVTVEAAVKDYRDFKSQRAEDTKRKIRLVTDRLKDFLGKRGIHNIAEVRLPDLVAFRNTWTGAETTRRRDQEIVKSFFWYSYHADYISKNPVLKLDPIQRTRPKTDPFEVEEVEAIFDALDRFPDEYGRLGQPIAHQTRAFVYVMRYTGLSIGDTAKLEKSHVRGNRIRTHRKKTGEDVFARVPQFVIDTLMAAPHDSDRYFFWTGRGKIHTRTSKWGERLQKLFVLSGVRVREIAKERRVAGRKSGETVTRLWSDADPHQFRHTFARDQLERGMPMEELAELLGNSVATIEKYYSKWDRRRQKRLEDRLEEFWQDDPITVRLNGLTP